MHAQINTNKPHSHKQRERREDGLSWNLEEVEKVGEVTEVKIKEVGEKEDRETEIKKGEGRADIRKEQ